MVGTLLLTGFVVGLDNFRVAAGLGTLNFTHKRRIQIALAFCLCEALAPLVGLKIGNVLHRVGSSMGCLLALWRWQEAGSI